MKKILLILFCFILKSSVFSQGVNLGFESTSPGAYTSSNSVSGWTISSQTATCGTSGSWTGGSAEFSIVATPLISFPTIGNIGASPLGGNNVARLNNSTANSSRTKLVQTFLVTSNNALLVHAYAGVWEGSTSHNCCEQSGFTFLVKNSSGSVLPCYSVNISPGVGCNSAGITYSASSTAAWTNWQTAYVDLSPYINSTITIEVVSTDCAYNDHFGTLFFDAKLISQYDNFSLLTSYPPNSPVSFCSGSNIAQITAPMGYSHYQWIAPGTGSIAAPQGTMSTLTLSNPISNAVYTVMMIAPSGCVFTATYAIVTSTVQIVALGSNSSCIGGSSGSASVAAFGSGGGYLFSWINTSNSVVATSSIVSNLASGIYSVQVTAVGSSSSTCGTANGTIAIGVSPPGLVSQLKPYCNNEAYLCAGTGTNYQWYFNSTAITSSLGGTIPCYTVTSPTNSTSFVVAFTSTNNCRDSVQFVLVSSTPGFVSVVSNPMICPGATNGTVSLAMVATPGAMPGSNWCNIVSTGSTSAYNVSFNPTTFVPFTAINLSAGGTYSVSAFDGACKYSTNFSVTPYVFNFTLTPSNTPTLCQGNMIAAGVSFSSNPSLTQYSYSWSPNTFLIGGGIYQNEIISPSVSAGSSITLVYTVIVTPSLVNCPLSKTLSISLINPTIPTINPIPNLCSLSPIFTITANPAGGTYSSNLSGLNSIGIISPTLSLIGANNFTYIAPQQGTCAAASMTGSFLVNPEPYINLSGNLTICHGQTSTLSLSGNSNSYTWSNGSTSSSIVVSPSVTSNYSVVGTSSNTCSNYRIYTMTVVPIPSISISGNSICVGTSGTLQASGANTYTWNTGFIGSNLSIPLGSPLNYTVFGANSQTCMSSATVTLSSVPLPTLSISGNTTICEGQSTTLLANGASTYSWSNSITNPFTTLTPGNTTVISVTGTDALTNCSSVQTLTVNVLPLPQISISGDTLLCVGESITLSASGANSYSWNTGSSAQNITVSPTISTNYSVIGTNTIGNCNNTKVIGVIVSECTGIDQSDLTFADLKIYPNPCSGKLFVETEHILQISIFDNLGKLISQKELEKGIHTLELSEFKSGMYLLKISDAQSQKVVKLLKTE